MVSFKQNGEIKTRKGVKREKNTFFSWFCMKSVDKGLTNTITAVEGFNIRIPVHSTKPLFNLKYSDKHKTMEYRTWLLDYIKLWNIEPDC